MFSSSHPFSYYHSLTPPPPLAAWSLCLLLVLFLNSYDFDGVLGGRALRASGQSVIFNWMSSVYSLLLLKPMAHLSGCISLLLHLTVFRFRSPNIRQFILAYDAYGFPHLKSGVSLKVLPII